MREARLISTDPWPAGRLSPVADLCDPADVRTGALTTRERHHSNPRLRLIMPTDPPPPPAAPDCLWINPRCPILPDGALDLAPGQCLIEAESSDVVVGAGAVADFPTPVGVVGYPALLSRPWHVRTFRDACLLSDLNALAQRPGSAPRPEGVAQLGNHPIWISPRAAVLPTSMLDATAGPIVIEPGAIVRPGCVICGPAYIGVESTVIDRALIKANTSIGPRCKVGGEVGGTIFQGLSNKSHDGYLGDSYVGQWVNLGAGTTNSNLLNTYSEIVARAAPDAHLERTGQTFLGCVLGDHVKTAICTRIMTGAVVGVGTMWAASAAIHGAVRAFRWVTDAGERPYRFDKFLEVARAAMARRGVVPTTDDVERLRRLHERLTMDP